MFQRFVDFLQRLWAGLSWTGGAHYLNGGPGLPPPLTPEEEKALLARMADGDPAARDALITHNLRLVVYLAKKYEGSGVPSEDMVSIGTIGLIKAVNTYRSSRRVRLSTYAARCIENEILMNIRSCRKYAAEVSLNAPIGTDKDGNEINFNDILGTDPDEIIDGIHQKIQVHRMLCAIRECLTPREQKVIIHRYGLLQTSPKTQRETARLLGISRSYVSRIEKKALEKLRDQLLLKSETTAADDPPSTQ